MKNFLFGVFVWFLFQLVVMSAAVNMNMIIDKALIANGESRDQIVSECADVRPALGFIAGALFPLASLHIVSGDFCWNY